MDKFLHNSLGYWEYSNGEMEPKTYTCYNCGETICSKEGYNCNQTGYKKGACGKIYICHICKKPTYFSCGEQVPGSLYGDVVNHLPDDIKNAYEESRKCFSVNAYTSVVLCCRKILMSIACEEGAEEGKRFEHYVNYLNDNGYIPPNGKEWVDKIRKLGNQATHKLETKSKEDAELAIRFTSMLLKFIYEFPEMLKSE